MSTGIKIGEQQEIQAFEEIRMCSNINIKF
jgi:hypothetical protein